jgi:hypothetical protein
MTPYEALATAWPSGIATQTLRRVEDAVTVGVDRRYHWFRGHSCSSELILPGIYREPFYSARPNVGFMAAQRFRVRSGVMSKGLPPWDDHISWLITAQHYGVPTRLLDWTESALVALYFATGGQPTEAGELWCMDPAALNNCSNWHLAQQDDPPVRYMAGEVFVAPKRIPDFMKRVGIESTPLLPLAFVPRFGFQRMAAQLSRFTIHPSAEPDRSIEWLCEAKNN